MAMTHHHVLHIEAPSGSPNAKISLPASKSISNRVLIIKALSKSQDKIENLSDSDDTRVMEAILASDGPFFDVGHAGTAMRFLTAYLSRTAGEWLLTGSERMQQRPVKVLVKALRKLGALIEYAGEDGFPPLKITGTLLKGGTLELDGSISSQYITALLLIAPTLEGGLTLLLQNRVTSRSYIGMTLRLLEQAGVRSIWKNNEITVPRQSFLPCGFTVESDWTAASYWYEILALSKSGEVLLENLRLSGLQGDEAVSYWFEAFGITTTTTEHAILITKKEDVRPSRVFLDFHENPDVGQTLATLCVAKGIPFHFKGLETLRIKETDRIAALQKELSKFGAGIVVPAPGELKWDGVIHPDLAQDLPVIDTYDDHRMAMAFAPMALTGKPLVIRNPGVVTKSYPAFWNDLRQAGFMISEA
jgi:3-phosphoshikimate 1-carboxyvinyltransferase